jgi:HlyD family secretion protein
MATLAIALSACSQQTPSGYQGYVEGDYVYVASPLAGRLDHLLVRRGDTIASGAALFALESEDEMAAVRQAEHQLSAALAQLEDLKTGKRPAELDVVKAQLAQAVAVERKSALQLKRDEEQFAVGAIAEQQLDDSRATEAANAAKVRELASQLESSKLPARADQIRAQTAQAAAARAALAQAQWRLARKSVAATRPGLIFDTLFREGEWVPAGTPVVKMLPPTNVKVRFFVPETALGSLSLGAQARIRCDGCKTEVAATVSYVSTESEYTPPVIYSNETRAKLIYMIEAHPAPESAALLHPGQPVEVRLD